MGACRETITREMARMQVSGAIYYSASTVVAAIDGRALMLTVDREYFYLKGHGRHDDVNAVKDTPHKTTFGGVPDAEAQVMKVGNLLANLPKELQEEETTILAELPGVRVERIVSTGQASPPGFWYDQDATEWVCVISGSASLQIEGEDGPRVLHRGDFIEITAHLRHRVEWTDANEPTVWLAVHMAR